MKKTTTLFSIILFVLNGASQPEPDYYADSDMDMQQKYWKYRDQLSKYFLKIGTEGGESMPCRARTFGWFPATWNPQGPDGTDFQSTMKWADATIDMGYYLALLATEYHLLERHDQDSQETLNELFYALKALLIGVCDP